MALRDTFWDHVKIGDPDDCWEWQRGRITKNSYGWLVVETNRRDYAHRHAFFLTHGTAPVGVVRHLCNNPPCCNPAHLRDGTVAENTADAIAAGTSVCMGGERNGYARVTDRGVAVFKQMKQAGMSGRAIARYFGLCQATVNWNLSHR